MTLDASVTSRTMLSWKLPGERVVIGRRVPSRGASSIAGRSFTTGSIAQSTSTRASSVCSMAQSFPWNAGGSQGGRSMAYGKRCVPGSQETGGNVDVERRAEHHAAVDAPVLPAAVARPGDAFEDELDALGPRDGLGGGDDQHSFHAGTRAEDAAGHEHLERALREERHAVDARSCEPPRLGRTDRK